MPKEFATAEGKRVEITNQQAKEIKKMYEGIIDDISGRIEFLKSKDNVSSVLRSQYLEELRQEMSESILDVDKKISSTIKDNMEKVGSAVVTDNQKMLATMGFHDDLSSTAYSYVPKEVINEIITGELYNGKWSLSGAIWQDNALQNKDLETIIARGVAANKSTYEIAKDLEQYVNPSAMKPWNWSIVYPGVRRKIDYNAQRLARTMVSHAYAENFVRTTKNNPFIEAYKWLISNSDRVCPVCIGRAEDDSYGLGAGIYPKDQLPLDHPNGMCTFSIVMPDSYEQIADKLADWYNGQGDSELNEQLDKFAEDLGVVSNKSADTTSIPDYKNWVGLLEKQNEGQMLEREKVSNMEIGEAGLKGIKLYTTKEYERMNGYLRRIGNGWSHKSAMKDVNLSQKSYNTLQDIINGLNNTAIPEDTILKRGTDLRELASYMPGKLNIWDKEKQIEGKSPEELNDIFNGAVIKSSSFISTSSQQRFGFSEGVDIYFYAPAGTKGASIIGNTEYASESETLLNIGTTFKIVKIEQDPEDKSGIRVFAEIIVE